MFRGAFDFQVDNSIASRMRSVTLVERPSLGMAGRYLRNRGYVVAFRIAVYQAIQLTQH